MWDELLEKDIPIVFINTSSLFEQFKDYKLFGHKFDTGSGAFSQMFYFFYRDYFWTKSKAKFIFMVSEEDALSMYKIVNPGFSILLNPIYLRKKINMLAGEKIFKKSFSKTN